MKIRLKDSVIVRTGKDKGKVGTITKILKKDDKVVIDGINEKKKNVKARGDQPGEQITFFAPIHISNVGLIDPKTGKATRVKYKVDGKRKTRIAVKSGEEITGKVKKTEKSVKKK